MSVKALCSHCDGDVVRDLTFRVLNVNFYRELVKSKDYASHFVINGTRHVSMKILIHILILKKTYLIVEKTL
jgi:hypothetical protein